MIRVSRSILLQLRYCRSFAINQQAAQSGVPGVLFGRYEGDSYDGGCPAAKFADGDEGWPCNRGPPLLISSGNLRTNELGNVGIHEPGNLAPN